MKESNYKQCVPDSVVKDNSNMISHSKNDHVGDLPSSPIVAASSQDSTSCCQSSVSVCEKSCHVEATGSPQPIQASEDRAGEFRKGTRVESPAHEGPPGKDHPFRNGPLWQEISHSGAQRAGILHMVHRSMGELHQGGTSRVSSLPQHVHGAHGEVDGDTRSQDSDRNIPREGCPQGQSCVQETAWHLTGQWQTLPCTDRGRESQRIRMVRSPDGLSTICPHGTNGHSHEPSRAEHAGPHEQYRGCPDHDCEPIAKPGTATDQPILSAMTSSKYQELRQSCENFNQFLSYIAEATSENKLNLLQENRDQHHYPDNHVRTEMIEYFWDQRHRLGKNQSYRYDLMEIYCSSESQLTKEATRLGLKAVRFGLNQGDLANKDGRLKLYEYLIRYQPRDIWMSPSCKAWCRWNQFNASKSPEAARKVINAREHEAIHMLVCDAVCQHQLSLNRHFHLEQPGGSDMMYQSEMSNIIDNTFRASCDQCTAGKLKHPSTLLPLKKNMQIFTTSTVLSHVIDSWKCSRDHPHDHVAGSFTNAQGQRQLVSQFTELYTATFARRVCRALMASQAARENLPVSFDLRRRHK